MHNSFAVVLILALGLSLQSYAQEDAPGNSEYRVIVNARSPIESLDRRSLANMFLKKVRRWPEDGAILPVDLGAESPARRHFSEEVLNRSVAGVKSYWQQLIFSGRDLPPPELATDEEVIQYVSKTPGAIGYISNSRSDALSSKDVKALSLR